MKKPTLITICILAPALILWGISYRTQQNDMAPNIPKGSWIWSWNNSLDVGTAVLIEHPHNPQQTRVRRIVATAGDTVQFINDGVIVNGRRLPQLDMRVWGEHSRVWQELSTNSTSEVTWEIVQQNQSSSFSTEMMTIPKDHVFLLCDNRANCIDSRWWGPVPSSLIKGTIRLSICSFCSQGMKPESFVLYY